MSKRNVKQVKRVKTTAKQQKTSASNMEKHFLAQPAKISAQYRKELVILAQHEKKLKKELKRLEVKHQSIKMMHLKLKSKSLAGAKKQLTTDKKMMSTLSKTITELTMALNQIKKQIAHYTQKQSSFANLNKQLIKLMSGKTSVKKPRKTLRNPTQRSINQAVTPETQESQSPVEQIMENIS